MKLNLEDRRHSAAHILAMAVLEMFPEAKLATGPAIDDGFYYDFLLPRTLIPEDLPLIQKRMEAISKKQIPFEKEEISIEEAKKIFTERKQNLKLEIIDKLVGEGERKVSIYKNGNFIDLCAGPHVEHTGQIGSFLINKFSASYWQGDASKASLQRIYGLGFASPKELKKHLKFLEEAKKRDHRLIGKKLDLFSFHEEGPGFPFWHEKGTIIFNEVRDFLRHENKKEGFQEIQTPQILSSELWHQSGHYQNYKENMYFVEIDERDFAVKPMNCPGGLLIYKEKSISYRDLPMRVGEFGLVHRHELSGVLHGLFRVRMFTQDDAHVFCEEKDLENEIKAIVQHTMKIYNFFGFEEIEIFIADKPEKAIGSDEIWEKSTKNLINSLEDLGLKYKTKKGEGAFYGPKIEFNIRDSLGREWQCGTIQVDFSMPQRFELEYVGKDGEKHRPVMLHRAVLGSLERFIGILIEHTEGNLPFAFSPMQVKIIPVALDLLPYSQEILEKLLSKNIRAQIDDSDNSLSKKIRNSELNKNPFIFILGEKEAKEGKVTVRKKGDRKQETLEVEEFLSRLP